MGYISSIYGNITFTPPLINKELRACPNIGFDVLKFDIDEEQEETSRGLLTMNSSNSIVTKCDQGKLYCLFEELEHLVSYCPGRTFDGEFIIEGEENTDIRKLFVGDDETVIEWTAQVTWPDGSKLSER